MQRDRKILRECTETMGVPRQRDYGGTERAQRDRESAERQREFRETERM